MVRRSILFPTADSIPAGEDAMPNARTPSLPATKCVYRLPISKKSNPIGCKPAFVEVVFVGIRLDALEKDKELPFLSVLRDEVIVVENE
jgi:hypothetical protein